MSTPRHAPLLIVEDDLALQKQLKWSLDRFESVTADDVASAVLQFRRNSPAVVTMDLGLPPDRDSVSEGFKCLEKLLELDPGVKVIVLTGQNDQDNALRAIRMGAYDFLAKPVDPDVLALTVERAYRLDAHTWGIFSLDRLARTPEFRQAASDMPHRISSTTSEVEP